MHPLFRLESLDKQTPAYFMQIYALLLNNFELDSEYFTVTKRTLNKLTCYLTI